MFEYISAYFNVCARMAWLWSRALDDASEAFGK
jgi:hypothetical protein